MTKSSSSLMVIKPYKARLVSIDILRTIAIIGVVVVHIPSWAPGGWRIHPFFIPSFLFDFGDLGVPLFVLISGFCIHRRASASKKNTSKYEFDGNLFLKRSFFRIYPPYIFAIIFSIFCAVFFHSRFQGFHEIILDLLTHLFFIHNLTSDFATGIGNGALWFLGMEVQLYGAYFLLIYLLKKYSYFRTLLVVSVVTISWRIATVLIFPTHLKLDFITLGNWQMWPFYYWLPWVLGAFAAEAYAANFLLPSWCYSSKLALLFLLLGFTFDHKTLEFLRGTSLLNNYDPTIINSVYLDFLDLAGSFLFLLALFCLLNYFVDFELKRKYLSSLFGLSAKVFANLGRISYSIYLTHVPIIYILDQSISLDFNPRDWLLRQLIYWVAILVTAYSFFFLIERHCVYRSSRLVRFWKS